MAFVPKKSVGASGMNAEMKRLAAYMNSHIVSITNIPVIATPDGTDATTTQTLCNANKAKINTIITALKGIGLAASVTLITTPDGTNAATTQTLANANKAKINQILTNLVAAGVMAP